MFIWMLTIRVSYCFKADSMITDVKVKSVKKQNLLRIFFNV